ncbi:hypothetical protein B0T16DRAFT_505126 [Cercophora newfieldiana]|uniref:Uncharacterized protein n=1 Tax=Cercophora newfieldiana TaxID=92897 RepID=A0AA40CV27_9PEZI|nr:hypothetical protein B0T16DRAFT_505126 [Cercophora newfieldiana]
MIPAEGLVQSLALRALAELLPPNLEEFAIRGDWATNSVAREQIRRMQLGYPIIHKIRGVGSKFPNAVAERDTYFCPSSDHEPYRTTIQNMVLPSKTYTTDGSASDRTPALQPMYQDLLKDPRRGFFTNPPRWLPFWERICDRRDLASCFDDYFVQVRSDFQEASIARGRRVWLEVLRKAAAAVTDDGREEESTLQDRGKDEDEDDEDEDGGGGVVSGAGKKRWMARRVARFIKESRPVSLIRGVGR